MAETVAASDSGISEEETDAIIDALYAGEYDFRIAKGIARETGIPAARVTDFLEGSPEARRAFRTSARGEPLYAPVDQCRSLREIASNIVGVLRHEGF